MRRARPLPSADVLALGDLPLIPPEAGMPTWWGDQGSPEACRWGAVAALTECCRGLSLARWSQGLA